MKEVYITGHRNPDLDSICSAYAYSVLKNRIDPAFTYKGVRCGHLSDSVKSQIAKIGIEAVPYMRDVYAKVGDVMITPEEAMDANQPIYNLIKTYNDANPSAMPVFENGQYLGLLSVDDITAWFLKDNSDESPVYNINIDNIGQVLPGKFLAKGKGTISTASIIVGAAAFEDFQKFIPKDSPSVVVMGYRKEHIEYAIKQNVSAIILTATQTDHDIDLSGYKGTFYVTSIPTVEAIRRLRMSVCVKELLSKQGPRLDVNDLFEDAKEMLVTSKLRGLSVFDGDKWVGYVTRRCFLSKPTYNVILVDHNEPGQSIKGLETACVREIIDHHRLDALKTDLPIFIDAEPLGSTCTIVYQQFLRHSVIPDEYTAKVLLTGIISDTLILKSPTTTQIDRSSAGALAALSGILDIQTFGENLFSGAPTLSSRDPLSVIKSDFKTYSEKGMNIGIGQCEATTLKDVRGYCDNYLKVLEEYRTSNNLDWAMLMVTDVLRNNSVLLITNNKLNKKLPYVQIKDGVYDMPGIMSRKKQLLPEILHTMD